MATITPTSLTIFGQYNGTYGDPIPVTRPWAHRLAGTAYVESDPMVGYVLAMTLDGPSVVGSTNINPDGTWEIINIAEKYSDKELFVIGVPRDAGTNLAIASREMTVN